MPSLVMTTSISPPVPLFGNPALVEKMPPLRPRREIMLQPGEHVLSDETARIHTLLGSCVSITLWHPERKIGAMSHFLTSTRVSSHIGQLDGRYGDEAVLLMLQDLVAHGIRPRECQAKIFGGGHMFPHQHTPDAAQVGQRNGEAARRLLQGLHIPILAESLFGAGHRRIIFDIATGRVLSRQHTLDAHGKPAR